MNDMVAAFRALHVPGDPLVLFNIWDAGSATVVAEAGAKAIATGSYAVAEAQGFKDGEEFPLDRALEVVAGVLRATDLPVTFDMESGYGDTPEEVGRSVAKAFDAGVAGINMEDRLPGMTDLLAIAEQAERLSAAAESGIFVNARCDLFRGQPPENHFSLIPQVLDRARAYADAGANGLFVPFTTDLAALSTICEKSSLPVNIIWNPAFRDRTQLAGLGAARISHGHRPWAAAMAWLGDAARGVLNGGKPPYDSA
ncbi:isocitrate lyase/phosphoenolpyruvate mutase family protein [Novosphingobium sp.]|uniref:isocitrate lyase/PEP mutase family protein n=1 Tax=Novosphingobium sp. TaxID=1874826 RepID=UPI0025D72F25|nr:isocitrate lyase/phosphoenolpyruvate mutase family protein [Novosphingobium sp.]